MPHPTSAPALEEVSDAELIGRVRAGDVGSYGTLFARHREAANRLARSLTQRADADDVVADAFAKVLGALQDGKGPDEAFRPYLLTAVRSCHVDRRRFTARVTPTDDDAVLDAGAHAGLAAGLDGGAGVGDPVIAGFEGGAALEAFRSLPERWQLVLWHLDVEGQKPASVAPLLGMAPNAVSALAYRAREGLRQAFLQQHVAAAEREECRRTHELLGAAVRGGLSRRDRRRVDAHLEQCRRCTALYLELGELNSSLRAVLAPVVLGGAAAAYLAGTTSAAGGLAGAGALLGRVRDAVVGNTQTALAAGAATAAAAAAVTGMVLLHTDAGATHDVPQAGAPTSLGSPAPAGHRAASASGARSTHPPTHPPGHAATRTTGRTAALTAGSAVGSVVLPTTTTTASTGVASPVAGGPSTPPGAAHHADPSGTTSAPPPATPPPSSSAPAPSGTAPTTGSTSTVGISAGLAPGGSDPVSLGVQLGGVPADHLASLRLDVAGQPIAISVP